MHVTNIILSSTFWPTTCFNYVILLFDAKVIISLYLVSVPVPVKLYIATLNFDQFDCSVTIEEEQDDSPGLNAVPGVLAIYSRWELRG